MLLFSTLVLLSFSLSSLFSKKGNDAASDSPPELGTPASSFSPVRNAFPSPASDATLSSASARRTDDTVWIPPPEPSRSGLFSYLSGLIAPARNLPSEQSPPSFPTVHSIFLEHERLSAAQRDVWIPPPEPSRRGLFSYLRDLIAPTRNLPLEQLPPSFPTTPYIFLEQQSAAQRDATLRSVSARRTLSDNTNWGQRSENTIAAHNSLTPVTERTMLPVFIAQLRRRAFDATTSSQAASTIGQSSSLAIGNENPNPRVVHSTQLPRAGPQDGSQDDTQPREFLMLLKENLLWIIPLTIYISHSLLKYRK
ncbi:hypothetical protein P3S67_020063 [Capsicum chacoense]